MRFSAQYCSYLKRVARQRVENAVKDLGVLLFSRWKAFLQRFDVSFIDIKQDGRLSKDTDESKAVALHRAKHGLINAETGLCLAAHATVNLIESRAGSALPDKGRMAFYLRKVSSLMNFIRRKERDIRAV